MVEKLRKFLNLLKKDVRTYKSMQDSSSINEELHQQFDNIKDEIKKLIIERSQEIYKVVPTAESPPLSGIYNTITIQCKQDVTPAFMWMLNSLVKDDVVRIIKGV